MSTDVVMPFLISLAGSGAAFGCWSLLELEHNQAVRRRLKEVGFEPRLSPFSSKRFFYLVGAGIGFFGSWALFPGSVQAAVLFAILGGLLPWLYGKDRDERRRWIQFRQMPDFLELFAMALSAGLNFERGLSTALLYLPEGALKRDIKKTVDELTLGRPRFEALGRLEEHLQEPRFIALFALLRQAIKNGAPLDDILIDQAQMLRSAAFVIMERKAQTASLRLLFPLLLFIFPTFFVILFGPLVIQYVKQGGILF